MIIKPNVPTLLRFGLLFILIFDDFLYTTAKQLLLFVASNSARKISARLKTSVKIFYFIFCYFQLDLVHLGAKYGPCMRWDETIDRQIQDDRNKVNNKTNFVK